MEKTVILGIETSCDETSASLVEDGEKILSSIVSSQVDFHKKFGGVVPEVASRKHVELLNYVLDETLKIADFGWDKIKAVAITEGPGLIGALMTGMSAAKAISISLKIPLITVNHLEGHIYSIFLNNDVKPPLICLIVSGGHTSIVIVNALGDYKEVGSTLDDAAGEAYDKVAKILGLEYPGGPAIEEAAKKGDRKKIKFPRALKEEGNFNFSFSGLKTAVMYYLRDNPQTKKEDIAASFEEAVVDILVEKTIKAADKFKLKRVAIAGGVSANEYLRKKFVSECREKSLEFYHPSKELATDNAAMIAGASYYKFKKGQVSNLDANSKAILPIK